MTEQEFLEEYGEVEVTFSRYYKFSFTYSTTLSNGNRLLVCMGGNADDIYRIDVVNNETLTVRNVYPYTGYVMNGEEEVCSFYTC